MPSRSRQDTAQTQAEIGKLYDLHCRLMKGAGLASAFCAVR